MLNEPMFRKLTFSLMSALVVGVVFASSASAMSYVCVGASDPRCVGEYNMNKAGLNLAAQVADVQNVHWGPTTILIGPGALEIDYAFGDSNIAVGAPIDFTQSTALTDGNQPEELHIVGAGRDQTTITAINVPCCGSYKMLRFDTGSWSASSVSDLTIRSSQATTSETELDMSGGLIENTRFIVGGTGESSHTGLAASGTEPLTVRNSKFDLGGSFFYAIRATAPLDISDTDLVASGFPFDEQFGIQAEENLNARRLRVIGMKDGIRAAGDDTRIDDTVVRIGRQDYPASSPGGTAHGIEILRAPDNGDSSNARLRGVTVFGDRQNQVGISVLNSPPDARTSSVGFSLEDSIVSLSGADSTEFTCAGDGAAIVSATIFYSMFSLVPYGAQSTPGCNRSTTSTLDRLLAPPQFVDSANDDFRPVAGSPTIDAGSDDSDRTPPKLDLARNPRFVDGNGDGSAIIDMGAFEFQPVAVTPGGNTTPGGGTTLPAALSIRFGKAVGKFKLKTRAKAFKLTGKRTKPRLPITSSSGVKIKLTLKKGKKKVKGSQSITIPAGTSYLTFSGKFAGKKLKPGRYTLSLTAAGLKDSPKSILNVIR